MVQNLFYGRLGQAINPKTETFFLHLGVLYNNYVMINTNIVLIYIVIK